MLVGGAFGFLSWAGVLAAGLTLGDAWEALDGGSTVLYFVGGGLVAAYLASRIGAVAAEVLLGSRGLNLGDSLPPPRDTRSQ